MQLCDLYKEKILGFSRKGRKGRFHAKITKGDFTQRSQREISCKDRKGHSELASG
jgi:hypothetical protein